MTGARTQSILVLGDGIVGHAAAIALRRALPTASVSVLMLPPDPGGWINRLGAAGNAIHRFHKQIGLEPRIFVQRARAEPTHLRHYVRAGQPDMREAATETIQFVSGVPLHHIWMRHQRESGAAMPDFAALMLRIRESQSDTGGFGPRFDPAAYAALLAEMSAAIGIGTTTTARVDVTSADDRITAVIDAEGRSHSADLYVDAAGPRSRLLTELGAEWTDWSGWIAPHALEVGGHSGGAFGEERLSAHGGGYDWRCRAFSATLRRDATALPAGRFANCWHGNAVAVGEAAVHAPCIDGTALSVAFEDILRMVMLLPRPDSTGRDHAEYDRRAAIAHVALANWSSAALASDGDPRPPQLAEILTTFALRGRVPLRELDPIQPGEWLARLMAIGPGVQRIDPTALALSPGDVAATIGRASAN